MSPSAPLLPIRANFRYSSVLNATSCTSTDSTLACLRALPYDTYYSGLLNSSYNPAPIPDGDFLTQSNVNAINQGKVVKKPVLIGATRDEATCKHSPSRLVRTLH